MTKDPVAYKCNYDSFSKWYETYQREKIGSIRPSNLKSWFEDVECRHDEIRDKIGGVYKTEEIAVDDSDAEPTYQECQEHISDIIDMIPGYIFTTDPNRVYITPQQMASSKIKDARGRLVNTGKNILDYAKREGLSEDNLILLNNHVAKLGEIWAMTKTKKQELWTTITTSPRGFISLGHYGPDAGSCFGEQGGNTHHKYILGVLNNSFTIILRTMECEIPEPTDSIKNVARLWGYYSSKNATMNFSNLYTNNDIVKKTSVIAICKDVSSKILEVPKDELIVSANMMDVSGTGMYTNGDGFTIHHKDNKISRQNPDSHGKLDHIGGYHNDDVCEYCGYLDCDGECEDDLW